MGAYLENIFSSYLSGFRKRYGCQHVLMRMIEKWCTTLDNKKVIETLSIDLSKVFDSLPHDIYINR